MTNQLIWEIIGYAGSALVLVSLLMTSIVKLRVINAIGCVVFSTYAFVIHSIPTALMNVALFVIDVFFLIKILSDKADFSCVNTSVSDPIVNHFCEQFSTDISQYFDLSQMQSADRVVVIFDNETVAGLLAGKSEGNRLKLIIDYTTQQYRDCKVGPYIYDVLSNSFNELVYAGTNEKHVPYCLKMGFEKVNGEYIKTFA